MINAMMDSKHPVLMYDYRSFYDFLGSYMKRIMENGSLSDYRSQLRFILMCEAECIENAIRHVTDLDNAIGLRSLLRHFSTWLIISYDPPPHLNITLDNVAFLKVSQKSRKQPITEIYTLMWMPNGREWSHVNVKDLLLDQLYVSLFPNTMRGLNGRQLRLAALEWPVYAERIVSNGKVTFTGASFDAIEMLKRKFNFSYVIMEPEDMLWGQVLKNGTCTGIIGMLKRMEADMCPVPYGISMARKRVMDFSSPFMATEYKGVYRRRPNDSHSWLYLLSCFSWQVYLCGIASLVWLLLLLIGIENQTDQLTSSWKRKLSSCFETGIRMPLCQALSVLPESPSARVLTCTWCLFCLIMTGIYTGNLVAVATVDKYEPPFTTLQELAENDEYAVGVLEGGYAESILMNTKNPTLKLIYRKITKSMKSMFSKNVMADHIQRVLDDKYVLIATNTAGDIIRTRIYDMEELNERLNPLHGAFAFPLNSPLMKHFDTHVLFLRELGLISKLIKEWTPEPLMCESSVHVPKLELKNLKTLIVTCAAFILLSSVVLGIEIWKKGCTSIK